MDVQGGKRGFSDVTIRRYYSNIANYSDLEKIKENKLFLKEIHVYTLNKVQVNLPEPSSGN